jgi:ankyrin repeat protein
LTDKSAWAQRWAAALDGGDIAGDCRRLVAEGLDVNCRLMFGETPLMDAAGRGQIETCRLLIEAGADVNAGNDVGRTALHRAATNGAIEVVQLLLDSGADIDLGVGSHGGTALHRAGGRPSVMRLLLAAGARVDTRNKQGLTPLGEAVEFGDVDSLLVLLEAGANPLFRTPRCKSDYLTPLERALTRGNGRMVKALYEHCKADLDGSTAGGVPLRDLAGGQADEELITFLNSVSAENEVVRSMDAVTRGDGFEAASRLQSGGPSPI